MLWGANSDSGFFYVVDKLSGFALINLLWIVLAIPIITLPAATGGLFAVMADSVRGAEPEAFHRFFGGMRQYWKKSTMIFVIDALLLLLVTANLAILPGMDIPVQLEIITRAITIFVGVMVLAGNLYIWTLLVVFDLALPELGKISMVLVFRHPIWTFFWLGTTLLVITAGVFVLPALIVIFTLFSGCVWLVARGAWRVIRQYEDELRTLSVSNRSE